MARANPSMKIEKNATRRFSESAGRAACENSDRRVRSLREAACDPGWWGGEGGGCENPSQKDKAPVKGVLKNERNGRLRGRRQQARYAQSSELSGERKRKIEAFGRRTRTTQDRIWKILCCGTRLAESAAVQIPRNRRREGATPK